MRQCYDNTPLALSGLGISWAMLGGLGFPNSQNFTLLGKLIMGKCAQHLPMRMKKNDYYVEPMD